MAGKSYDEDVVREAFRSSKVELMKRLPVLSLPSTLEGKRIISDQEYSLITVSGTSHVQQRERMVDILLTKDGSAILKALDILKTDECGYGDLVDKIFVEMDVLQKERSASHAKVSLCASGMAMQSAPEQLEHKETEKEKQSSTKHSRCEQQKNALKEEFGTIVKKKDDEILRLRDENEHFRQQIESFEGALEDTCARVRSLEMENLELKNMIAAVLQDAQESPNKEGSFPNHSPAAVAWQNASTVDSLKKSAGDSPRTPVIRKVTSLGSATEQQQTAKAFTDNGGSWVRDRAKEAPSSYTLQLADEACKVPATQDVNIKDAPSCEKCGQIFPWDQRRLFWKHKCAESTENSRQFETAMSTKATVQQPSVVTTPKQLAVDGSNDPRSWLRNECSGSMESSKEPETANLAHKSPAGPTMVTKSSTIGKRTAGTEAASIDLPRGEGCVQESHKFSQLLSSWEYKSDTSEATHIPAKPQHQSQSFSNVKKQCNGGSAHSATLPRKFQCT